MDVVDLNYLINPTILSLLSLIIIFLCSLYFKFANNNKGREPPLVAGAWPILGHLPLLSGGSNSKLPHKIFGDLADQYGPLFTFILGSKPALVLNNWEIAKECFTKNDLTVSSRPNLVAVELMAYNQAMPGFAPYGPYWRELRKIQTLEILSNRRVEQLGHIRESEVRDSIRELFGIWSNWKSDLRDDTTNYSNDYVLVEMKQWFSRLTFNAVLRMVVGKRYFKGGVVDEKGKRCLKALKECMRLMGAFTVGDAIPFLRWFDFGGHEKAMKETAKELDKILGEWLEEHRRNMAFGEKDQDFMSIMLSFIDETTIHGFDSDTIIKATILGLILGGTETTSVTLTWAICLILRDPLVLEKAKAELDAQIGKERCVSESDITKLVYLQAIVKETLRIYPAAPLSAPREFTENCTLGGYNIKKGTRLITNLWKIQTDPNVWIDPLEFKPERFLTTHKDFDLRGHHFELIPFGSGRRICPGISFSLQIVHLVLANFLHSFDILNQSTEPIDMSETLGISNTKTTPLEILVKPRLSLTCYETNM